MNAAASNKLNWQETSNKRQSVVRLNSGLQKTSSGSGHVAGFESVISAHHCATPATRKNDSFHRRTFSFDVATVMSGDHDNEMAAILVDRNIPRNIAEQFTCNCYLSFRQINATARCVSENHKYIWFPV